MLHLPDITLVMIAGDVPELATLAWDETLRRFSFEATLAFANTNVVPNTIITSINSTNDVAAVAWREVAPRLTTSFALFIHWDGYATRPDLWSEDFRQYDMIGAVWPWYAKYNVGNTGFSLQSLRLLTALAQLDLRYPEDVAMCRYYRPYLEQNHGIKFAPETIADRFSIENGPIGYSFGFHGLWNMLGFLNDDEVIERLTLLPKKKWRSPSIDNIATYAMTMKRRELYRWILKMTEEQRKPIA